MRLSFPCRRGHFTLPEISLQCLEVPSQEDAFQGCPPQTLPTTPVGSTWTIRVKSQDDPAGEGPSQWWEDWDSLLKLPHQLTSVHSDQSNELGGGSEGVRLGRGEGGGWQSIRLDKSFVTWRHSLMTQDFISSKEHLDLVPMCCWMTP